MPENPKRIHLIGEPGRYEEAIAAVALIPGQLGKLNADGALIAHDVAGGPAESIFTLEDALQGKTIDNPAVVGETTPYIIASKGDVIYAFLEAGQSVTPADYLASAGNGNLQEASGSNARLAVPLESLDLSDSDAEDTRIRVRIL